MEDINVQYADMPTTIRAYTAVNNDMSYTIVINSKLNNEQQLLSYQHEINHIINGDYEKRCGIDFIEITAHSNR
ncbi:MAG: ImmA/IrrE family metallo-endopeptidase [Lachnospiraceae bacterium]